MKSFYNAGKSALLELPNAQQILSEVGRLFPGGRTNVRLLFRPATAKG